MGASNSWNPQGLSRPVMGLLYPFFTFLTITSVQLSFVETNSTNYALNFKESGV